MSTESWREDIFAGLSGRFRPPARTGLTDTPLVIAVHGGSYTSAYFDIPGYSLLERAAAIGIPVLAIDRPAYGASPPLAADRETIEGQAAFLGGALEDAWARYGEGTRGIVLIGHSIGGAIATTIASLPLNVPLLGLAVSGVGLRTPQNFQHAFSGLPDVRMVELPTPMKDQLMFGPPGSFTPDMPAVSHPSTALCPRAELIAINQIWAGDVARIASQVIVPVHYRQSLNDPLWVVDESEVSGFAAAFSASPRVDAAMVRQTGHCMDFHRFGAAFQVQQLGFALQCASSDLGLPGLLDA